MWMFFASIRPNGAGVFLSAFLRSQVLGGCCRARCAWSSRPPGCRGKPGLAPAVALLSFASPKESTQRKGEPKSGPLRAALRCLALLAPGGVGLNSPSAQATPTLIRQPLRCSARSHGYLKAKVLLLNSKGGATQVFKEEQVLKRNCFSLRTASCDRVKTRARSMCSKA